MIKTEELLNGTIIVGPIVIGAYLSGLYSLAENAAIPITIFQLTLLTGFLLYFFKKLIQQDITLEIYGMEKWYLLFFLLIFFSIIYSPEREQALFYSVRFGVLILMTYLIYNSITNKKEVRIICYFIIAVATFLAILSLLNAYQNPEFLAINYLYQGQNLVRESGTDVDPNRFAISFTLPIMLLLSFFLYEKKQIYKFVLGLLLLIVVSVVLITYSRSSWISIFFAALLVMKYHKKYSILIYGFLLLVILIATVDVFQTFFISIFERIKDIFAGTEDDSSSIRILLLIGAIRMFFDSYMIGVGFEGFGTRFQTYFTPQETIGVYEPHNEYYRILSELGLIGFLIFMTLLLKIIQASKTAIHEHIGIERSIAIAFRCSLISYLIFYLFYSEMIYNSVFFILVALIFVLSRISTFETEAVK